MVHLKFLVFDRRFFCCAPWSYLVRVPWQLGYLRPHLWALDVSLCLRCLHWSHFCRGPGWQVLFQRCFTIGHCGGTLGTRHVCSLYGIQVSFIKRLCAQFCHFYFSGEKNATENMKLGIWPRPTLRRKRLRFQRTTLSSSQNALNWAIQICNKTVVRNVQWCPIKMRIFH